MKNAFALFLLVTGLLAQQQTPSTAVEQTAVVVAAPAAEPPAEVLDIAPLAPPDMTSPYASPRDAARHRFQSAMTDVASGRDIKLGIREMSEAFATDRTYAPAAFNLGLLCAVAGKWQDAIAALTEASRLDPRLQSAVEPQLRRLRLIGTLESTPEGQRARRYDHFLYALLRRWKETPQADAASTLVQIGRIDPRRWEAPGLLAGLLGEGRNFDAAGAFLEIAAANTSDPAQKAALQKALVSARRETRYAQARREADLAAEKAEYTKAAEMYEAAWKEIPARADSGMYAASAYLLSDNTQQSTGLLQKLKSSPYSSFSSAAASMLKELEPIEPLAKAAHAGSEDFYKDPGSPEPVRIADLIPVVDKGRMELLATPLPRMTLDGAPVMLLDSFNADRPAGSLPDPLPVIAPARMGAERPWTQIQHVLAGSRSLPASPVSPEQTRQTVETGVGRVKKTVAVETLPPGAEVYVDDSNGPLCNSPCDVQMPPGVHSVRVKLAGYEDQGQEVRSTLARVEAVFSLIPVRGRVKIDGPSSVAVEINGKPLLSRAPLEVALLPGLYRFSAGTGSARREQLLNVRPSARLRLTFE